MIGVIKGAAPAVLTTRGTAAAIRLRTKYAHSSAHRAGKKPFKFNSKLYGHADVRDALCAAQHDKCAFCESKFKHIAFGDVEHFRPKGGFRQKPGDPLTTPGYYWLAYTWENLFASCTLCNQKFKENLFPIASGKDRARSHAADLNREKPYLLDPATDPVEKHITFVGETPVARNGSKRGARTIRVLGLDRPALNEVRLKRRADLIALKNARDLLVNRASRLPVTEVRPVLDQLNQRIAAAILDTAEYAAMARIILA